MSLLNGFDNDEVLNEGKRDNKSDLKVISSHLETLYCHMLKYKFCIQWQDPTWEDTITRISMDLNKYLRIFNKVVLNSVDMNKCFEIGEREANKETGKHNQSIDKRSLNEFKKVMRDEIDWLSLDDLSSSGKINAWILANRKETGFQRTR